VAARGNECGAVAHTSAGYDESPDYDAFWDERDYLGKAAAFRVPVFLGGGWQDYNVKMDESVNLFNALPLDDPKTLDVVEGVPFKRMVMQQMTHGIPTICSWQTDLDNFFDHFLLDKPLKGANVTKNGQACSQGRVGSGTGHSNGGTITAAWPPPGTTDVNLSLSRAGTAGAITSAPAAASPSATFSDAGIGDEVAALRDPARQDTWLWYTSPPLAADTRMAGEARLNAAVSLGGTRGALTPVLVDLGPDGTRIAARGFLDLRYRNSLKSQAPITAGAPITGTVVMKPQDYTFKKGTRIGVLLLASNSMWVRPDLPGQSTTVLHGAGNLGTTLTLPLVAPPAQLFDAA
jgi:predicted acyl esterase